MLKRKVIVPTRPTQTVDVRYCATCGKQLAWINVYSRWYCYACRKYVCLFCGHASVPERRSFCANCGKAQV